jgi:hypothetical protein
MPFTLLHISDLHRAPDDPISNHELLSSLISDIERHHAETPPIPHPDAIVVTGDVVQGAPLHAPNHAAIVEAQYESAYQLLTSLTDRFVDGDRTRVVIVPGNHDVDWNVAYAAMEPIDDSEALRNRGSGAFGPTTELRWSWKERQVYRIANKMVYEQRLDHFRRFIARFYEGTALAFPLDVAPYYQLFELDHGRIGVAALNSCSGNDCFTFHGSIPDDVVAEAHLGLHDRQPRYDLMMAAWHHNVEGPPGSSDYMDLGTVYRLIGAGFRLGLHGHQHRGQATNRYIHLPEQEPMAVVSAGSLCAGPRDLPTGINRQYNVIEISDDFRYVRVHIREMAIETVFAGSRRPEFGGASYVDMKLGQPIRGVIHDRARDEATILRAEQAQAAGDPNTALALLRDIGLPANSYARALALDAATNANNWQAVTELVAMPTTIDELVVLVRALIRLRRFDEAEQAINERGQALELSRTTEKDLRNTIAAARTLG